MPKQAVSFKLRTPADHNSESRESPRALWFWILVALLLHGLLFALLFWVERGERDHPPRRKPVTLQLVSFAPSEAPKQKTLPQTQKPQATPPAPQHNLSSQSSSPRPKSTTAASAPPSPADAPASKHDVASERSSFTPSEARAASEKTRAPQDRSAATTPRAETEHQTAPPAASKAPEKSAAINTRKPSEKPQGRSSSSASAHSPKKNAAAQAHRSSKDKAQRTDQELAEKAAYIRKHFKSSSEAARSIAAAQQSFAAANTPRSSNASGSSTGQYNAFLNRIHQCIGNHEGRYRPISVGIEIFLDGNARVTGGRIISPSTDPDFDQRILQIALRCRVYANPPNAARTARGIEFTYSFH